MTTHRWRFVILPLVLLAGLAAFAYYAFRAPAPAARGPAGPAASAKGAVGPVAVEVARVALAVVQEDIDAVGTLRSNEAVVVRPEISGRIERLNFTEGAAVRKGQVIVALDDSVRRRSSPRRRRTWRSPRATSSAPRSSRSRSS